MTLKTLITASAVAALALVSVAASAADVQVTGPEHLRVGPHGDVYVSDPDCSVIFRIDTSGNFNVVHGFNITDGSSSGSGLSRAADGRLYGTTIAGGPFGGNGAVGSV